MSYRATVVKVVYGCEATASFERADWIALALAALDQAGIFPRDLADAYRHANGDTDLTVEELIS